jgi:hypothetical protein
LFLFSFMDRTAWSSRASSVRSDTVPLDTPERYRRGARPREIWQRLRVFQLGAIALPEIARGLRLRQFRDDVAEIAAWSTVRDASIAGAEGAARHYCTPPPTRARAAADQAIRRASRVAIWVKPSRWASHHQDEDGAPVPRGGISARWP